MRGEREKERKRERETKGNEVDTPRVVTPFSTVL